MGFGGDGSSSDETHERGEEVPEMEWKKGSGILLGITTSNVTIDRDWNPQ